MMATHSQRGVPRSGSVSASQVALDSTEAVSVRSDPLIVPNYSMVAKDLSLWYGKLQALKNVSVPMREGIITGLIGPSGGGKTTLLRCLNRIKERCGNVTEIARKGPQARQPIEVRMDGIRHTKLMENGGWIHCTGCCSAQGVMGTISRGNRHLFESLLP